MCGFLSLIAFRDRVGRRKPIVVLPHATLHPGLKAVSQKDFHNANSHKEILKSHGLYFLDIYHEAARLEFKVPVSSLVCDDLERIKYHFHKSPDPTGWKFHWDSRPDWIKEKHASSIEKMAYEWAYRIIKDDYQPPGSYTYNPKIKPELIYKHILNKNGDRWRLEGTINAIADIIKGPIVLNHINHQNGNWTQEILIDGFSTIVIASSYATIHAAGYNNYYSFYHAKDCPNPLPGKWEKGMIQPCVPDKETLQGSTI